MGSPAVIDIKGVTDTQAIVMPDPLTVNGLSAHRANAPKLVAGVAAWTSSDMFKTLVCTTNPTRTIYMAINKTLVDWKTKSKEMGSLESKSRIPGTLKGAARFLKVPGIISLGGGLPCSEYFPIDEISIKIPSAPYFSEKETKERGVVATTGKYDVSEGRGAYDLSIALNYGQGTGSAQLLRFVTEHTEIVCNPPYADWQCVLTVGSTSALDQAYRMFTERGDYIMCEEYTFTTAVETAIPMGLKVLSIKMDVEGLIPEDLDQILSSWDVEARGARKPCLLYTIPSGQNPTGATQGTERRKALYKVAQKHDLYILEDEPYYFLQMQPYTGPSAPAVPPPANNEEFLRTLVPTLLSMDIDGRVMRLDSFSKVIAPGTRTGWITASEQIVERFVRANETSVQNPSGISQVVLYKMLDESWGHVGYLQWLLHLRLEYTKRRDAILAACEKYLPSEVVSWNPPAAGMFLWLELAWSLHPNAQTKSLLEIEEEIFHASIAEGVLMSRGSWFAAERDTFVPTRMFFRATFAAASAEKMADAIERFGGAVRTSFGLK